MTQRTALHGITPDGAASGDIPVWNSTTGRWEPAAPAEKLLYDAKGDILIGTADNTRARLALGSNGQVLTADSTQTLGVKWATPASGMTDPTTTKGDLITRATSAITRRAVGSNGQVLTADSAETDGVKWATPASGSVATDAIWDNKGDLAIATAADAASKLPVGSNGQVLTADSTQSTGVKWASPAGGSVDAFDLLLPAEIQRANLDATYGDDFSGSSLNARWTRRTVASGNENWNQTANGGVRWDGPPAAGWMYLQTAPAGDFQIHAAIAMRSDAATTLAGPCFVDSSGAGVMLAPRGANGFYPLALSAYAYSSYGTADSNQIDGNIVYNRGVYLLSIKKVGTTYTFAGLKFPTPGWAAGTVVYSTNSVTWSGTVNRIGIGVAYTDGGNRSMTLLRFNKT